MTSALLPSFASISGIEKLGPNVIVSGKGRTVTNKNGHTYLDAVSGLWNHCFGFDHPELTATAKRAYDELPGYHLMHSGACESTYELADALAQSAPMSSDLVFFSNSGSEAVETAIKSLWLMNVSSGKPKKRKIISRWGAYHGVTIFANSLIGKEYAEAFGVRDERVLFADHPHYCTDTAKKITESEFVKNLITELSTLIKLEGADNIAAFIAEPIMGVGGTIIPPQTYFPQVQKLFNSNDIPIIADEIICGLMRTGNFWGSQTVNLIPDIIVSSKCLTAGYFPLAATIYSSKLSSRILEACKKYDEFPHGHTTSGHPVGCRIALNVLQILKQPSFRTQYESIALLFSNELDKFRELDCVHEVRCSGLMAGIDLSCHQSEENTMVPMDAQLMNSIDSQCRKAGVIFRFKGNTVLIAPPYTTSDIELTKMLSVLRESIENVAS